jgi:hypothetical protein
MYEIGVFETASLYSVVLGAKCKTKVSFQVLWLISYYPDGWSGGIQTGSSIFICNSSSCSCLIA